MKTANALILVLTAVALAAGPSAFARAPAHRPITHLLPPSESVKVVFERYLEIHTALAQDSLDGVTANAVAIAKAMRTDPAGTFGRRVANRADKFAAAKDLGQARDAYRRLTAPLDDYAKRHLLPGLYEGYCPMHRGYWLQAGPTARNPYMGVAMPRCGFIRGMNGKWIA